MRETRQIDQFRAVSEDGEVYTLVVFQEFIDGIPGFKEIRTSAGEAVNYISDDEFEIIAPFGDIIVHKE